MFEVEKRAFDVESDVPIPRQRRGKKVNFPFRRMKVGDSFFVPNGDNGKPIVSISTVYNEAKNLHIPVTVRQVEGGYRCWRLEHKGIPADGD